MDIQCLGCQEPWDVYHMRHDAIWDAIADGGLWPDILGDGVEMKAKVRTRWPDQKLTDEVRAAFSRVGWEFGSNILTVLHCPCCKPDSKPVDAETKAKVQTLGTLLEGDLDGLASEINGLKK